MNASGWIQLSLYVVLLLAITKPMGIYLQQVLDPERAGRRPFLQPFLGWFERICYRILRVDPAKEQSWKAYAIAMLVFSFVSMVLTYGILRLQNSLPLNPQGLDKVPDALAFNTSASFTTNTNWQSYVGETTMSYFSQMVALAVHNYLSAAVGIAIAAAVIRGICRDRSRTIGNFWVDLIRLHLYLLLPICLVYAMFLVSQGIIQNFRPYSGVHGPEQAQTITQGPVASQVAIKMLGTNGGGYVNANAAHPFENPTPLSNFVQILSIFAIPSGLTHYLGRRCS
jgi:K+-transporting ATPase ATPase A chain